MRHALVPVLAFVAASVFGARSAGADAAPPPPPAPVPAPAPAPTPAPTPPEKPVERGYLGFQPLPSGLLSPSDLEALKVKADAGVVVVRIFPGGPAEKAGVKVGDVLTKIGAHDVPDVKGITADDPRAFPAFNEAFQKFATEWKPGAEVEFVVVRDGKPVTLKAVAVDKATMDALLQAAADKAKGADGKGRGEPAPKPSADPEKADANRGYIGFVATPVAILSPKEKAKYHVTAAAGVVAVGVVKGSPAEAAGLKDGDVILKYAGQDLPPTKDVDVSKPASVEAYESAWFKLASAVKVGADVAVVVERDGKPVTLTAKAVDVETIKKIAAAAGEADEDGEEDDGDDEGAEGPEKGAGQEKGPDKTPPPEKPATPDKKAAK